MQRCCKSGSDTLSQVLTSVFKKSHFITKNESSSVKKKKKYLHGFIQPFGKVQLFVFNTLNWKKKKNVTV